MEFPTNQKWENWPKSKNQYFAPIKRNENPNESTQPQIFPRAYHTVRHTPQHKTAHTQGLHGNIYTDKAPTVIQGTHHEGSQTHFLVPPQQHKHEIEMGPSKYSQRSTKIVLSSQTSTKAHTAAERQVRVILRNERYQQHFLAKREAVIDVQTQFFSALRHLYTWPMDQLTFAATDEVRDHWYGNLEEARKCAYRAESIDPNYSGPIRYDTMCEIVRLENQRINEFYRLLTITAGSSTQKTSPTTTNPTATKRCYRILTESKPMSRFHDLHDGLKKRKDHL
jgi:hypothetical protein